MTVTVGMSPVSVLAVPLNVGVVSFVRELSGGVASVRADASAWAVAAQPNPIAVAVSTAINARRNIVPSHF